MASSTARSSFGSTVTWTLGLAAAYAVTGVLGMELAAPPGNVTAVWLPAGLALAALLGLGHRVWPGITLGSFLCNIIVFPENVGEPVRLLGALAIAVTSTVGLLTIAVLVRRGTGREQVLSSPAALLAFGAWTAVGCAINATGGLLITHVLSGVPAEAWLSYWLTWWLGDGVGILLVAPLLLRETPAPAKRPVEWVATLAYTLGACQLVFGRPLEGLGGTALPLAFMMLLGAAWAGVRLGARAVSVHALVIYPLMSWATMVGSGPFAPWPRAQGLVLIDALLVVVLLTGLLLATSSALSRAQQAALEAERTQLEARVRERTAQLEASSRSLLAETEARGKLAAQLVEAQKQDALGRLAGGVAHDFNNLLAVVSGEAELLRRKAGQDVGVHDGAGAILAAAQRATELTRRLLAIARRQPTVQRYLDVGEALASSRRLLRPLFPESVHLDVRCVGTCGVVLDPTSLDQLVMNLALNARDAVHGAGRVQLEAETRVLDDEAARALGLAAGRWVRLAVRDDGVGIAPELVERIFEPFFTTKPEGRGTGLGLSMVLGIAQQAGGTVKVHSEPGLTEFAVWLPAAEAPLEPSPPPPAPVKHEARRATVLVVEDEPLLRRTVVLALEHAGHRVLAAGDGEEALGVLRHPEHGVELVLTDVVMPRVGGVELAREVRATHGLPVVFMSGFHDRQAELDAELVLGKPFSAEALLAAIETKLRGRPEDEVPGAVLDAAGKPARC